MPGSARASRMGEHKQNYRIEGEKIIYKEIETLEPGSKAKDWDKVIEESK